MARKCFKGCPELCARNSTKAVKWKNKYVGNDKKVVVVGT